ncbi:MAG TPA: hypothetical protein PLP73_01560 [Candidatus Absconditabacterales bacterium]|nr:hypothetical protein [Candidatus Absconditabacterales bacterium]
MLENISKALIFDCVYDPYKGVVAYVKIIQGSFKTGDNLYLIHSEISLQATEVGYFSPEYTKDSQLTKGQIGYIVTGLKSVRDAQIGDTIIGDYQKVKKFTEEKSYNLQLLAVPGFKKSKPFVYAGVYPIETPDYDKLKDSLEKLSLNDSSIEYSMEDSKALGLGFRCGFLGMLHMDIIKERLSREFDLETIFTTPTVVYLVKSKTPALDKIKSGANVTELAKTGYYRPILLINGISQEEVDQTKDFSIGEIIEKYGNILKLRMIVKAGSDIEEQGIIDEIYEPIGEVEIVGPQEYTGEIMSLCQSYRGEMQNMEHIDQTRVVRKYLLPMGEIIVDFYDRLKSATKGYATMNYEFKRYQKSDLVKLDIYLNGEKIEALSMIIHKDNSAYQGRDIVKKLKELIPRHMFVIPIQAGIGNKMIARENISALKKDVIAKCYGGDISRKRKLLQKQKEGKKKMKAMGSVNVPSDVFIKMVTK